MKRIFANMMMTFGLASMFIATPVFAQSNAAVAEVPFPFEASGHSFSAGKYSVSQITGNPALFAVLGNKNGALTFLGAPGNGDPQHPSLTFQRSGGEWVLVKVTPPNSATAYSLGHDPADKNKKLQLAAMVSVKLR